MKYFNHSTNSQWQTIGVQLKDQSRWKKAKLARSDERWWLIRNKSDDRCSFKLYELIHKWEWATEYQRSIYKKTWSTHMSSRLGIRPWCSVYQCVQLGYQGWKIKARCMTQSLLLKESKYGHTSQAPSNLSERWRSDSDWDVIKKVRKKSDHIVLAYICFPDIGGGIQGPLQLRPDN